MWIFVLCKEDYFEVLKLFFVCWLECVVSVVFGFMLLFSRCIWFVLDELVDFFCVDNLVRLFLEGRKFGVVMVLIF